jgi:glucose-6-phosphate isomerase
MKQSFSNGSSGSSTRETTQQMDTDRFIQRLWSRDVTLWKDDPEHQEIIARSLGWLTVPEKILEEASQLSAFAEEICGDGFSHLLLMGMGGSSLCPEVFRRTFGRIEGYPQLLVLDSTDPATIRSMEKVVDISKTLFMIASKSGTTTEPLMFYRYFYDKVSEVSAEPGRNFIAITDPDSRLERIAREKGFRRVFQNMADIGGRYSALSYFGMVPAALMGLDVKEILERAVATGRVCGAHSSAAENPAARLAAALAQLARQGRNRLTLVISPPLDSLGLWIEQLIAESTGKEGQGILPVAGEKLGPPGVYAEDRVFLSIRTETCANSKIEADLEALEKAGHPVIEQVLPDALSLGGEFFLWEFATALAGALLGINPFDQPNVQESKDNTRQLLEIFREEGRLPEQEVLVEEQGCQIFGEAASKRETLAATTRAHLDRVRDGDYVALTAYIPETREHDQLLDAIRLRIRDVLKVATTVGYGPRFLHSTGQLHKGGAANGIFIQITAAESEDLAIPGEPYTFGVLKQAQALGDFQSLVGRHRPALRFHLGRDVEAGLKTLLDVVKSAVVR